MIDKKDIEKVTKEVTDEIDEDRFFKYCESLVDVRKFNNIREWMEKKGYTAIEKYKESLKRG